MRLRILIISNSAKYFSIKDIIKVIQILDRSHINLRRILNILLI